MLKIKHYIVETKPIGIGHYGKVYRAYDSNKKREVAIKEMNIMNGEKEAHIMKQIPPSKYFPTFYEYFTIDEKVYVVMEFIEGERLGRGYHYQIEKWDEKKGVQITINILKAADELHQLGFIHNDIMPKNVMIKDNLPETIKVYDFHLAKEFIDRRLLKELKNIAQVSMVLLNGVIPKEGLTGNELKNGKLMAVLMKALEPTEENRYDSAKDFFDALLPFS